MLEGSFLSNQSSSVIGNDTYNKLVSFNERAGGYGRSLSGNYISICTEKNSKMPIGYIDKMLTIRQFIMGIIWFSNYNNSAIVSQSRQNLKQYIIENLFCDFSNKIISSQLFVDFFFNFCYFFHTDVRECVKIVFFFKHFIPVTSQP